MKKKFNIYLSFFLLLILGSCSIAGSWVYEKADDYLASYFKNYANFTDEQINEIENVTENYLDWFTRNELPKIRTVLVDLKDLNVNNADTLIINTYVKGQEFIEETNNYLETYFVEFSETLTDLQVIEIGNHFEKLRIKRKESRKEEGIYSEEVFSDYISGFKRLNIKLNKTQKDYIRKNIKEINDTRYEWSVFQEKWVEELIIILNSRSDQGFDNKLTDHLKAFGSLGGKEFQSIRKMNEQIGIEIISNTMSNASEKQINSFKRRIETYIASIDRILSNRSGD